MDAETLQAIAQLGGTVFVVIAFLWYLTQKNGKQERAHKEFVMSFNEVVKAQRQLSDYLNTNTKVLMNVAERHGLDGDAKELMRR